MKHATPFLLCWVLVSPVCSQPLVRGEPVEEAIAANNRFAFDLYAKLSNGSGNVFFSPYSLSIALAMTHTGACGETGRWHQD